MILAHLGKSPRIDPTAYVAPNAVVCGDVTIGADCRILFGAQIIAEGAVARRRPANASSWRMPCCAPGLAIP